jgi:hypothetical protein
MTATGRPTREQWKRIEQELCSPYGRAELLVDGYRLTLDVQCIKPRRYTIMIYVNDHFKGSWVIDDCEERRRFFRRGEHSLYGHAKRERYVREFGKRRAEKLGLLKTFTSYSPHWPTFGPLRRHLVANNKSIAIVKIGQQEIAA